MQHWHVQCLALLDTGIIIIIIIITITIVFSTA
jgi:hypothetical protein